MISLRVVVSSRSDAAPTVDLIFSASVAVVTDQGPLASGPFLVIPRMTDVPASLELGQIFQIFHFQLVPFPLR